MQYEISEVKYLGLVFSKEGLCPDPRQVQAIQNIEEPKDKKS